jgi:hypothetical protein
MLTNTSFHLSKKQLAAYNAWGAQLVKEHFDEECLESLEISIVFSFSLLGRSVEARVGNSAIHRLVLEDTTDLLPAPTLLMELP